MVKGAAEKLDLDFSRDISIRYGVNTRRYKGCGTSAERVLSKYRPDTEQVRSDIEQMRNQD